MHAFLALLYALTRELRVNPFHVIPVIRSPISERLEMLGLRPAVGLMQRI